MALNSASPTLTLNLWLRLDVAHPVGALAFGDKIEAPAMLGEPNLDFTRLTGHAPSGRQVEVHGGHGVGTNSISLTLVMLPHLPRHRNKVTPKLPLGVSRSRSFDRRALATGPPSRLDRGRDASGRLSKRGARAEGEHAAAGEMSDRQVAFGRSSSVSRQTRPMTDLQPAPYALDEWSRWIDGADSGNVAEPPRPSLRAKRSNPEPAGREPRIASSAHALRNDA